METNNYYLGLDMGTSSVGWAVTDENYQLLRKKGKDLWGIREFEEAETAVARRNSRISRRRRQREQVRIGLLKSYFADDIARNDGDFFTRLENSKYHLDDKDISVRSKYGVFNDADYTDKEYYSQYPTIFHLRKELIYNEEPHDVRLVFLALLNIYKHRGHFLSTTLSSDSQGSNLSKIYEEFAELTSSVFDSDEIGFLSKVDYEQMEEILGSRDYSRTRKAELLAENWKINTKNKREMAFVKAVCGLKVDAGVLFGDILTDGDKKIEINFSDSTYEDKLPDLIEGIGEEFYAIIELMKQMYDIGLLSGIMKGYDYLSDARVAEYEKHKADLKKLKAVVKKYKTKADYDFLFRDDVNGTYSAYVNSYNFDKKKRRSFKERKQEDLYKTIKKLLKDVPQDDEQVSYILAEIGKETFLPKQLTASNGVIPNQVHTKEMKKILSNAEKYLPFLKEKDESGLSVSERIVRLFTFQIPYYVGPTTTNSENHGGNGWVVRKEAGQILPWNIEKKIDLRKTSECFIKRMVRECTYISDEKVLPKASLEYEAYCVLNEINNIKVNDERIAPKLKQEIFIELFGKGKKVTKKQLCRFLINRGVIKEDIEVSGIDVNINSSLSSYGKFKAIFGTKINEDKYREIAEQIIFWCTVYGDSRNFLKEQLEENYKDELSDDQIKRILGFKFKDWGRLSKEFIELQGCVKSTGEMISLIRAMWETNYNMMELIHSDEFTFAETLEEKKNLNLESLADITVEDLDEMYFSAPVKRMVWQTIKIIREITEVMDSEPKRVFIEMTREADAKKERKDSRKIQLLRLYKNIKDESHDWKEIIESADASGKLRSKKMYLYIVQMGRDMYTGEPIDLDNLFNKNIYDIDHIYPRHFVKDDNINNNLVLVNKTQNANKSDSFPLAQAIRDSQRTLWYSLKEKHLITDEKYKRLTRSTHFTEEEKADFIARQMVETRQGTKGVADILKQILPNTELIYSKASNVSDFRNKYNILKSRLVNDFHHAHDAYLNIVVGNAYYVKFTRNPLNFIRKDYALNKQEYNLGKMFEWDIKRGKETAWIAQKKDGEVGTIAIVKKMLAKNTPMMTRMNLENHGKIADATIYGADKAKEDGYIPLKSSDTKMLDVTKYGGFSSVSTAYFFLVEHEVKNKKIRTIETVPVYLTDKIKSDPQELVRYCEQKLNLINPSIRMEKIKIQSLVKRDGYYMHLSGKTGKQCIMRNAVNLCLDQEWINYIRKLENYSKDKWLGDELSIEKNLQLYYILTMKHSEQIFAQRPNSMGQMLIKSKTLFENLAIEEQVITLISILQLTAIGPTTTDLTKIGGSANSGKILINKKISDCSEFKLINQSITGVYENTIDLLTI
ncbi:MAG: type II CRISPR RNA-guided endonuclease Cas9 [Lachnospiraceae bacterium]|nr:type II CRISPR RNA-guided endonuclease Cas9 [Lachnospiraceae bacterium]